MSNGQIAVLHAIWVTLRGAGSSTRLPRLIIRVAPLVSVSPLVSVAHNRSGRSWREDLERHAGRNDWEPRIELHDASHAIASSTSRKTCTFG